MNSKPRKASWEIHDLAWKIQTSALSSKLLLVFLGSRSNNSGQSWHGYDSIRKHTGLSRDSINRSARYLRDELKILRWEQGGGFSSNRYQLDLEAMRKLVEVQKDEMQVSDGQTGTHPMVGLLQVSDGRTTPSDGAYQVSDGAEQVSDGRTAPIRQSDRNPHITLSEPSKTTLIEPGPPARFFGNGSTCRNEDSGKSAEHSQDRGEAPPVGLAVSGTLPQAPSPKVVHGTVPSFAWWGRPLSGYEFIEGEDAGYKCLVTGKRLSFDEAQRIAQKGIA